MRENRCKKNGIDETRFVYIRISIQNDDVNSLVYRLI